MAKLESIGIKGLEAVIYYVHDLARRRTFLMDQLDFQEIGASSAELTSRGRQQSAVLRAAECTFILMAPVGEGGRAWRYLRKHPEGVGTLVFEVEEIDRTFRLIEERGATPIEDIQRFEDEGGTLRMFSITTPLGDTTFRFVERRGFSKLFPGLQLHESPVGGSNTFGLRKIDHVTSNFQTMAPALLWMEHVLGLERFWKVEFHTRDVAKSTDSGSGLRSVVMRDPQSGIKFANNEPVRPFFKESQINIFAEEHRGDGIQHLALEVTDILGAVRGMRKRNLEFMSTPDAYYELLPERIEKLGVGSIDEPVATLRELGILMDGSAPRSYLLQIFLKEASRMFHDDRAGPFFFEFIQRKGSQGFGEGNFRALFESIERQQMVDKLE